MKVIKLLLELVPLLLGSLLLASGEVHILSDADFDEFVDKLPQEALLLVDFYKPSCRACQRLSPVLDFLEAEWERDEPDATKRWFKLAKVDVEMNPRLKSVFGIKRIPDLRFVRAGQWGTYQGGRSIEDLQEFKERMALVPLRRVDETDLLELAKGTDAVFVLAADVEADPATVAPGVLLAATLAQHMVTFCVTPPEVLSSLGLGAGRESPALVKVVADPGAGQGEPQLLQMAVFKANGDAGAGAGVASATSWAVSRWVENERFGLVTEISAANFARLGGLGRIMVLGIFDPKDEGTPSFHQTFGEVAKGFGLKHADKLIFGTVNRRKMSGFVETFRIYESRPRVVVMDMSRDVFYTVADMPIGTGEIEAFLIDVLAGYIPSQKPSTDTARYVMKVWWIIQKGGAWSLLLLIPVVVVVLIFCDSPQREEAREARRQARQSEKEEHETKRLKTD